MVTIISSREALDFGHIPNFRGLPQPVPALWICGRVCCINTKDIQDMVRTITPLFHHTPPVPYTPTRFLTEWLEQNSPRPTTKKTRNTRWEICQQRHPRRQTWLRQAAFATPAESATLPLIEWTKARRTQWGDRGMGNVNRTGESTMAGSDALDGSTGGGDWWDELTSLFRLSWTRSG